MVHASGSVVTLPSQNYISTMGLKGGLTARPRSNCQNRSVTCWPSQGGRSCRARSTFTSVLQWAFLHLRLVYILTLFFCLANTSVRQHHDKNTPNSQSIGADPAHTTTSLTCTAECPSGKPQDETAASRDLETAIQHVRKQHVRKQAPGTQALAPRVMGLCLALFKRFTASYTS